MKITKFGHSCLLVEEGDARFLFDPGKWSTLQNDVTTLDALLITHPHSDHVDTDSIATILVNNPGIPILTNPDVGKKLEEAGIAWEAFQEGSAREFKGVRVEAFGTEHDFIHKEIPLPENTGFMVAEKFYHPGDTVQFIPPKPVEILALPVVAPWCKMGEVIDYGMKVTPKTCIAIHDALSADHYSFAKHPKNILGKQGIEVIEPELGKRYTF